MEPTAFLQDVAAQVWHASWQASILAALVLAISYVTASWLDARFRFALWLLVFARLAMPVAPAAAWSLFALLGPAHDEQIVASPTRPPMDTLSATPLFPAPTNFSHTTRPTDALPSQGITGTAKSNAAVERPAPLTVHSSPAASEASVSWRAVAGWAWLLGFAAIALRRARMAIHLRRERSTWKKIFDPRLLASLSTCRHRSPVRRKIDLVMAPDHVGPATCGLWRPTIVIPENLLATLSAAELRLVLTHELVHIERHDWLFDRLASWIAAVHWFNPAAWLTLGCLRRSRELACDATVLSRANANEARQYGHVLVTTVERLRPHRVLPSAIGIWDDNGFGWIQRRIRSIASYRKPTRARNFCAAALLAVLAAVGLTDARGEPQGTATTRPDSGKAEVANSPAAGEAALGTLSGTVVDSAGKPISKARIRIEDYDFNADKFTSLATAESDEQGRFRLGPMAPFYRHRFDIRVEADGFALGYVAPETYSVIAGQDLTLGQIRLERGSFYDGQVLDIDGQPKAGAAVEAQVYRHTLGHTISYFTTAQKITTDAEGRYRTGPWPVGTLSVLVRAPERQIGLVGRAVRPNENGQLDTIRLEADVPITGIIRDDLGQPVEGAEVEANTAYTATSGADGRFVLRGFGTNPSFQMQISKPGNAFINWSVRFKDDGLVWSEVSGDKHAETDNKVLDILMPRSSWIEGRAIDANTGEPVELSRVTVCQFERKPNGEVQLTGCSTGKFQQPEKGQFRVEYGYPNEYHLALAATGYNEAEAFTPKVTEMKTIDGIVVKMTRTTKAAKAKPTGHRFTGNVTRDGQPVTDGWVGLWKLRRPSDSVNAAILRGRTAEPAPIAYASAAIQNGTYSVDVPFQESGWYLVVEEPGHALTQVGPFTIGLNEQQRQDINCRAGGGIRGRVEKVPPEWQGQWWVVAFNKKGVRVETRVADDETFAFERLPVGEYGLKVGYDGYLDNEVPRAKKGFSEIPDEAWKKLATPWERAKTVTIEAGKIADGVLLELPE